MKAKLTVEDLTKKLPSKYALATAAARRGRAITEGDQPITQGTKTKPVTIALEEIETGLISVNVPPFGVK